MSLKYKGNLQVAKRILTAINKLVNQSEHQKDLEYTFSVETYGNCREHGFCITDTNFSIVFSEFRSSDSIVIYFGKTRFFGISSNIPEEEVYKSAKFYDPGNEKDAADFIFGLMITFLKA